MDTQVTNLARPLASSLRALFVGVAVLVSAFPMENLYAQVPEPDTVFFGRVYNRTSGQEYQVTSGSLSWTILGDNGVSVTVTSELASIAGGNYSYVLKVPHQAQSYQLTVDSKALPLSVDEQIFRAGTITVNGVSAAIRSNASEDGSFAASQPTRANVHRIDLEVFDLLADSDGDGIADWWEDKYGLNKQWAGDAKLRNGTNHFTYLQDFQLGLDPTIDDSAPQLQTTALSVLEGGSTGLLLKTVTSAVLPSRLIYRLTTLPQGGIILLRNIRPDPQMPDRALKVGESISQETMDAGLLEFVHNDPSIKTTSFHVTVSDGISAHQAADGDVAVTVYKPDAIIGGNGEPWLQPSKSTARPTAETATSLWKRRSTDGFANGWVGGAMHRDKIAAFLLSKWFDYSVWDISDEQPARNLAIPSSKMTRSQYLSGYVPKFGTARNHVLLGGIGKSRLEGGMGNDILVAGLGQNTLRGNGGSDFYVFGERVGSPTIEDFKSAEGDVIDVSSLLNGSSTNLADYLKPTPNGDDTALGIDADGGGTDYSDATIMVKNTALTSNDLLKLWRSGNLFTGGVINENVPVNHAPKAMADQGFVLSGQPVTIPVLANDTDQDGDVITLIDVNPGAAGSTEIVRNAILYTPSLAFAGSDTFTYKISDGNGGTADGTVQISYAFPAMAGLYAPLLLDADGNPAGQLRLTLLASGAFTVKLTSAKGTFSGTGKFDASGLADIVLATKKDTQSLHLAIDLLAPDHPLTGTLTGSLGDLTLVSDTALSSSKLLPTKARRFTLQLPPPVGDADISGHGFATLSVSTSYAVAITGQLADGTSFTAASNQRRDGTIAWNAKLYSGLGWFMGTSTLLDTPTLAAHGSARWFRLPSTKGAVTQPGFDRTLAINVSTYVAPSVAASHALDFTDPLIADADLLLRNGGLSLAGEDKSITFGSKDSIKVTSPVGDMLKLSLSRTSGVLSGTFKMDGSSKVIRGVIMQDENRAFGYFLNGGKSGSMEISPQ